MKKMKKFKKKICVITSNRADYGQLRSLIKIMLDDKKIILQLIVAGTHFDKSKGFSYYEILKDKFPINYKIIINIKKFKPINIANYNAKHLEAFSKAFEKLKPNLLILFGDRHEMLSAANAALFFNIPIAHLHGGEITTGVIDDTIRNAITKMSDFHFVANNIFKKRVIEMGEKKSNVFSVGSLTTENIKYIKTFKKECIEEKFKFNFLEKNLIITIHPEKNFFHTKKLVKNLFISLNKIEKNCLMIFTSPNPDKDSDYILSSIKYFLKKNKNSVYIPNFGYKNYISCLKICNGIIGNSSSGITEAPMLKKFSINIGDRQKGRPLSRSVFQVSADHLRITNKINYLLKKGEGFFKKSYINYYYKKKTKFNVLKILKKKLIN